MAAAEKTRFHRFRLRLESHVATSGIRSALWEVALFLFKQGWACFYGGALLLLVAVTHACWPQNFWLPRYDFLFFAALALQLVLLATRMETPREAKVILLFHIVGTLMELFKTHVGSWTYPEHSFIRLGGVPLFSGFMYASVGSYLARISRILDMRYTNYPSKSLTSILATLIYLNFFTHHFLPDLRLFLFAAVAILFGRSSVYFRPYRTVRRMPLMLGFSLVALFIWAAENISTFAHVWMYPDQANGWHVVQFSKLGSWFLLMIISFILVTQAHTPRLPELAMRKEEAEPKWA